MCQKMGIWTCNKSCLLKPEWKILNKEFGSTYLCNRLSHRQLGREGKAVMGGCAGVVMYDSHFVLPVLLCW